MRQSNLLRQRLIVLGLLGAVLFNFPFLGLPSGSIAGLPGTFVYLFGAWAALIAVAALLAEKRGD